MTSNARHRLRLGGLVAALLLALALPALAAALLPLTGRVVDQAGMIDQATEQGLVARLEAFEAKSSDQIVVATLDSLDGDTIEDFANRQFREWRLGQAGEDNGILLLVARDDRKMRIEVGYGLEGTLTDLHSRLIIENTMVPAFRAGDFAAGISGAVDDIILVLEGNAAELEARAKATQVTVSPEMLSDPEAFKAFQESQSGLTGALSRLLAVVENYPDLKANQNFLALQAQLEGTENRIAVARRDYIEAVRVYNTSLRTFPSILWNSLWFGNEPFQNFTVADDAMQPPKVDFGTQQQGG